ncbi:MAG: hypothetical protein AB7H80_15175 [Candidatus Kapaibacterium sp.]
MGLFGKKKGERGDDLKRGELSEQFSLTVIDSAGGDHQEKLKREIRLCATCSYQIINPMTDRCPRCFSLVQLSEHTNCGECDYQGNCALAEVHQKMQEKS